MRAHGFEPDFPPQVAQQLDAIAAHPPAVAPGGDVRDLRSLLWSSIDNDTSRDLDQLEVADKLPNGDIKVLIAIADVDAFVPAHSPIDAHAAIETTSVYTGVHMFPMLPEALSTGATSLLEGADKLAIVIEFVVSSDGSVHADSVYRAVVRNTAQLTYNAVGPWLEHTAAAPAKVAASTDLQHQLSLQDAAAQSLMNARHRHGALSLESIDGHPNRATHLIEDFMIAANEVVARTLEKMRVSSIRRIVKTPERWDRIAALARALGTALPPAPSSSALNDFLIARRAADPDHFPDLSLSVIKLMGPGEYILERPGDPDVGHFGLAVQDYTHATAPNRRFPDLVTQRLVKAALAGQPSPYTDAELETIARECTLKENAARKVEREMSKRIAAAAMSHRIGETFDAMVTGVTPKGTFVRVITPHVEGLLARGQQGADVGDALRVTLVRADVNTGYIDFARA